jgi:large subunit ribosomal protein L19
MARAATILASIDKSQRRQVDLPEFRPGDSIKVWAKIREGEKTRLQAFEGVCIRRVARGARSTFTVRKISYGVGVERIFPDNSPNIDKIEVLSRGKVNQSRLYYLRDLSGKAARIKEREHVARDTSKKSQPTADGQTAAAESADGKRPNKKKGKKKKADKA